MASSFITLSKPFASHKANLPFPSTKAPTGFRRSLRVNAIATKYELTKVVPQADRVLIRLEELPQKMDLKDEDYVSLNEWNSDSDNNSSPDSDNNSSPDSDNNSSPGDKVDSNIDDIDSEAILDPIVHSVFESPYEAEDLYVQYARIKGFDVRRYHKRSNPDGVVKSMELVCNRQGFCEARTKGSKFVRRSRDETKCGCKARCRIAHDSKDNIYRVTHFEVNHNHPLETLSTAHRLKCNRYMTPTHKVLLTRMSDAGIRTCRTMDWLEYMEGGSGKLSFTRKDGYNFMTKEKMKLVRKGDVNTAISFLEGLQVNDEDFIFKYTIDESDNSLNRLFWADGFSKTEYRLFGDVLLFDSTYKTNSYKFSLVILSGVDNHLRTCIFGAAIMYNETIESYRWLLKTFCEAMDWKDPISILTDQDAAMHHAIEKEFPYAKHRLCSWHLQKNCRQKLRIPNFCNSFASFLKKNISIEEFEVKWHELIQEHGLLQNHWVKEIYAKREFWSEAHFRGHFFGMMRSTQRAESINSSLKDRGGTYGFKITHFLKHYCTWLSKSRATFKIDQHASQSPDLRSLIPTTLVSIQRHAASIYTRYVFFIVEKEIFKSQGLMVEESKNIEDRLFVFTFVEYGKINGRRSFVEIDWELGKFECYCLMLESDWIPCCHLFAAFKCLNLSEIPIPCIYKRWTVEIGRSLLLNFPNTYHCDDPQSLLFTNIYKELVQHCNVFSGSKNAADHFVNRMHEVAKDCREEFLVRPKSIEKRDDEFVRLKSIGDPPRVGRNEFVRDPLKSKSRGAPKSQMQRCGICREQGHKSTTCQNKTNKDIGDGGQPMEEDNRDTQSSSNVRV